jgi:hypothetical protein
MGGGMQWGLWNIERHFGVGTRVEVIDFDKDFEIHSDAFNFVIRGVLVQDGRPVAFESKKLSETKQRWATHEKEMCRNPTLAKCGDETHTPKVGDLESSGTPESL